MPSRQQEPKPVTFSEWESDMKIHELHQRLERDYETTAPHVAHIRERLRERGEDLVNDHIALRTFGCAPLGLERLIAPFVQRGYQLHSRYRFPDKSLRAVSLSHDDHALPLVFASELLVDELPIGAQELIGRIVASSGARDAATAAVAGAASSVAEPVDVQALGDLLVHPSWPAVTTADYLALREVSEYASWVAAFGIRVNHITVSCNHLRSFPDMRAICDWLRGQDLRLNGEPNVVMGSEGQGLEQCSTLAAQIPWRFADGELVIPGSYVEFAKRYADPASGQLYRGFLEASADKIFESTDARHGAS